MEHIAYCDAKAKELEQLLQGKKTMLIRGAAGRKLPHGRVQAGETVYLIENLGDGLIKAKGVVRQAIHSDQLTADGCEQLIQAHADKLQLTPAQYKRWQGKRYLCLIQLGDIAGMEPFSYNRSKNMDDWIIVEDIDQVKKT